MSKKIKLSNDELEIGKEIYNKRIEFLIKLGEVKLSEIENEKKTEENYFNLTELNTREHQFISLLRERYGRGSIELSTGFYITHPEN